MLINPKLLTAAPAQILVWRDSDPALNRRADRCERCQGHGELQFISPRDAGSSIDTCPDCQGVGWLGIDPYLPTNARPGSVEKLAVLVARQTARCKLWHALDNTEPPDRPLPAEPQEAWQAPLLETDEDWEQQAHDGLAALIESL